MATLNVPSFVSYRPALTRPQIRPHRHQATSFDPRLSPYRPSWSSNSTASSGQSRGGQHSHYRSINYQHNYCSHQQQQHRRYQQQHHHFSGSCSSAVSGGGVSFSTSTAVVTSIASAISSTIATTASTGAIPSSSILLNCRFVNSAYSNCCTSSTASSSVNVVSPLQVSANQRSTQHLDSSQFSSSNRQHHHQHHSQQYLTGRNHHSRVHSKMWSPNLLESPTPPTASSTLVLAPILPLAPYVEANMACTPTSELGSFSHPLCNNNACCGGAGTGTTADQTSSSTLNPTVLTGDGSGGLINGQHESSESIGQSGLLQQQHNLYHPSPSAITAALNSTPTPILNSDDTYICWAYSPRCFIIRKVSSESSDPNSTRPTDSSAEVSSLVANKASPCDTSSQHNGPPLLITPSQSSIIADTRSQHTRTVLTGDHPPPLTSDNKSKGTKQHQHNHVSVLLSSSSSSTTPTRSQTSKKKLDTSLSTSAKNVNSQLHTRTDSKQSSPLHTIDTKPGNSPTVIRCDSNSDGGIGLSINQADINKSSSISSISSSSNSASTSSSSSPSHSNASFRSALTNQPTEGTIAETAKTCYVQEKTYCEHTFTNDELKKCSKQTVMSLASSPSSACKIHELGLNKETLFDNSIDKAKDTSKTCIKNKTTSSTVASTVETESVLRISFSNYSDNKKGMINTVQKSTKMDSTGTIPDYVDDQNLSGIDSMVSDIDLNNQNTVEDDGVSDLRDASSKSPNPANMQGLPMKELRDALRRQLEYYFSYENLPKDQYLQAQMDKDNYVPVSIVANFELIKRLTNDINLVVDVLRSSSEVDVDETGTKVKPNSKRRIIILRDVPDVLDEKAIENMFDLKSCPVKLVKCEFAHNQSWYLMFANDDDAQRAITYLKEELVHYPKTNTPIMARIKAKPVLQYRNKGGSHIPNVIRPLGVVTAPSPVGSTISSHSAAVSPVSSMSGSVNNSVLMPNLTPPATCLNEPGANTVPYVATSIFAPYSTVPINSRVYTSAPFYPPMMQMPSSSSPCFDLSTVFVANGLAPHTYSPGVVNTIPGASGSCISMPQGQSIQFIPTSGNVSGSGTNSTHLIANCNAVDGNVLPVCNGVSNGNRYSGPNNNYSHYSHYNTYSKSYSGNGNHHRYGGNPVNQNSAGNHFNNKPFRYNSNKYNSTMAPAHNNHSPHHQSNQNYYQVPQPSTSNSINGLNANNATSSIQVSANNTSTVLSVSSDSPVNYLAVNQKPTPSANKSQQSYNSGSNSTGSQHSKSPVNHYSSSSNPSKPAIAVYRQSQSASVDNASGASAWNNSGPSSISAHLPNQINSNASAASKPTIDDRSTSTTHSNNSHSSSSPSSTSPRSATASTSNVINSNLGVNTNSNSNANSRIKGNFGGVNKNHNSYRNTGKNSGSQIVSKDDNSNFNTDLGSKSKFERSAKPFRNSASTGSGTSGKPPPNASSFFHSSRNSRAQTNVQNAVVPEKPFVLLANSFPPLPGLSEESNNGTVKESITPTMSVEKSVAVSSVTNTKVADPVTCPLSSLADVVKGNTAVPSTLAKDNDSSHIENISSHVSLGNSTSQPTKVNANMDVLNTKSASHNKSCPKSPIENQTKKDSSDEPSNSSPAGSLSDQLKSKRNFATVNSDEANNLVAPATNQSESSVFIEDREVLEASDFASMSNGKLTYSQIAQRARSKLSEATNNISESEAPHVSSTGTTTGTAAIDLIAINSLPTSAVASATNARTRSIVVNSK